MGAGPRPLKPEPRVTGSQSQESSFVPHAAVPNRSLCAELRAARLIAKTAAGRSLLRHHIQRHFVAAGLARDGGEAQLTDDLIGVVVAAVRPARPAGHGQSWEALAKTFAGGEVVADQIAVIPPGAASDAKAVNADIDQAIEKNLDAVLIENGMHDAVKYSVKSGVVTLTGNVNSQGARAGAEKLATAVPSVTQVVNVLQVKNQKASSSM